MQDLKNITLVSINCVNPRESYNALKYCSKFFNFYDVILFTDDDSTYESVRVKNTPKLTWETYNDFVLHLDSYIESEYVLIIQDDGHIVNPNLWTDQFLKYDYIGAPWPSEMDWIERQFQSQQEYMKKHFPQNRVGNGGFSLRSKKFLKFSDQYITCDGIGEDSFLCTRVYEDAIEYGIKFAPFDVAVSFSYENPCIELGSSWNSRIYFDKTKHFGWHGKNFINTHELLSLKDT